MTKNAWILVNRYCLTFNIYRPFLVDSSVMNSKIYTQIEKAVRDLQPEVNVNTVVTTEEIRHAVRWVMRDNPDIFWFAHQYHYDKVHSSIHFQYTFSKERVNTIQQSINDVIENDFCIEYVRKLTPQDQITYVYKWLVSYCNYNTNSAYNQTIYSVFVRRNSVCTGYAKAAQYLFKLLDIDSRLVFGRLHNDKEDGRHCWNIVKVDNQYYHFDACFGDSVLDGIALKSGVDELFTIGSINYNFLCVSTDEILRTRSVEDIKTLPACPTSWSRDLVKTLVNVTLQQRDDIKGCLLSHIGSSADIYLCSKDKNTILKIFRSNSKTTAAEEYEYMHYTRGCAHILQCNEQYTDPSQGIIAIEQSTTLLDLLCSHYYELSLKGLIKIMIDIAIAWGECFSRGVLYRDIHICNIYRSNDGMFKLGDFGSCTNDLKAKEVVGNQWFMAPETLLDGMFTESSAVYSISMIMYFILNDLYPAFWKETMNSEYLALERRIKGVNLPLPIGCCNLPFIIKSNIKKIFSRASAVLPQERISGMKELIDELMELRKSCGHADYIVLQRGFGFNFNLDARNENFMYNRMQISRDLYHKLAKGDEIERMCTTAYNANQRETLPVDNVEKFAQTCGISKNDRNFYTYDSIYLSRSQSNHNINDIGQEYEGIKIALNKEKARLNEISSQIIKLQAKRELVQSDKLLGVGTAFSLGRLVGKFIGTFAGVARASCNPTLLDKQKMLTECDEEVKRSMSEEEECKERIEKLTRQLHHYEAQIEKNKLYEVYSSIFAPAEVKRKSCLQVQVYLHLSDKNAERRDYVPLSLKLKKGDKVDVEFKVCGEICLMSERKSLIWQGSFTKCTFEYWIPSELDLDNLSCRANLFVNGVLVGEMRFLTQIVDYNPRNINPEIFSHCYKKIFISYAHKDFSKVKFMAQAYKAQGVDYFLDRDYLKAGDIYPKKIQDYIDSADLFVLCWSRNAAESDYVAKEKAQALSIAKNTNQQDGTLTIHPISIVPRAELPDDMKDNYNFENI